MEFGHDLKEHLWKMFGLLFRLTGALIIQLMLLQYCPSVRFPPISEWNNSGTHVNYIKRCNNSHRF